MLLKPQRVIIAALIITFDGSRTSAFVQDCARAKKNGGKHFKVASAPDESLLFSFLYQKAPKEYQQRSPRMSEEAFRLDYIQGLKPSYNKIPVNDPVEDDCENTLHEDFVYGHDCTCYRGLTKPTKAGLVLALVLASGMIVASPDYHSIPLPSLNSVFDLCRQLMGDDVTSELSTLIERMAFQWDMLGFEAKFHGVSDQVASSLNNELIPFVSQQCANLQEATTALSGQFDTILAHATSEIGSLKDNLSSAIVSPETMMNQVLFHGKNNLLQHSNEWQLACQAKIEQFNHHIIQTNNDFQGGISQALNKGKELFIEKFQSFRRLDLPKIDLHHTSGLQAQAIEQISRCGDAVMLKSSEFQQSSQLKMDDFKMEMLQMNQQIRDATHQYQVDTKGLMLQKYPSLQQASTTTVLDLQLRLQSEFDKCWQLGESLVAPKYSEFQQLLEAKSFDVEKNLIQETESIRSGLEKVGTEIEMRLKEVGSDLVPTTKFSSRLLHEKILVFLDTISVDMNKLKNGVSLQNLSSIQTKQAIVNQVAFVSRYRDSMTTDPSYLKMILEDMAY